MNRALGMVRIAAAVPRLRLCDVSANLTELVRLAEEAAAQSCDVVVFPELCVTGYTCGDLFHQTRLLDRAEEAVAEFAHRTAGLPCLLAIGTPVRDGARLYNCAAVLQAGRLLGLVPKQCVPNYKEYYEARWFDAGRGCAKTLSLAGAEAPLAPRLLFRCAGVPDLAVGVEICEDLWVPSPPSGDLAVAGATILLNLSASNDLVAKAEYRRALVAQQSARCVAAYAYASSGCGESSTDLVFGGHALVAENGRVLAESDRFRVQATLLTADVDVDMLLALRRTMTTFTALEHRAAPCPVVEFSAPAQRAPADVRRVVDPHPFVPSAPQRREERCREVFALQSTGLASRLQATGIRAVTLGVSGGLDSTLALLVCAEAFDRLGLPHSSIHAVTMPGFGTSRRTARNARGLALALGLDLKTIDIRPACIQHFADIGHDGQTPDTTFENVQARERTQVLMDLANRLGALVVGTGDLSELALGWCTYNADHMSMYGVNCGVPKTLVRHLIDFVRVYWDRQDIARVLTDILDTPVSPELLPPDANGEIEQKTEEVVGPYELHDFFLYHLVRNGFEPRKILALAMNAFAGTYAADEIRHWLRVFLRRFFAQQFKRSCLPDGPKVGTVSLSPRGDWRMPSDASAAEWLCRLEGHASTQTKGN